MVTEAFSFLDSINALPGIRAGWVERMPGIDVTCDRNTAMARLRNMHQSQVDAFAGSHARWWRAEQVHGHAIGIVPDAEEITAPDGLPVVPGVDGLITNTPGQLLGIYVADCGAIWLVDRKTSAIGLLHSGKKGTEGNILGAAIRSMTEQFGSHPQDITAVLSPCIRPPDYEIDFAADIGRQAADCGISLYVDCQLNTANNLERFYSYRKEHGQTGRMMAMIIRDT